MLGAGCVNDEMLEDLRISILSVRICYTLIAAFDIFLPDVSRDLLHLISYFPSTLLSSAYVIPQLSSLM